MFHSAGAEKEGPEQLIAPACTAFLRVHARVTDADDDDGRRHADDSSFERAVVIDWISTVTNKKSID